MPHRLRAALVAVVALALPVAAACDGGSRAFGPEGAELTRARQRWEATRPAAYAVTVRVSCFCLEAGRAVVHEVRGTALVARRDAATGAELPIDPYWAITVDDLFARIAEARAAGADEVRVRYDAARGFPAELYVDRSVRMADEEYGVTLSDFTVR